MPGCSSLKICSLAAWLAYRELLKAVSHIQKQK
jgi:hypothetical protein